MLERAASSQSTPPAIAMTRAIWKSLASAECDLTDRVQDISCPVLLVFGKSDPIVAHTKDGKLAKKAFGDTAGFVVLEARHMPYAEVPEDFIKAVVPFLTEE